MNLKVNGDRIKDLRRERLWTLQMLSTQSGLRVETLCRLERNQRTAKMSSVGALAQAFGVEPKELLQ